MKLALHWQILLAMVVGAVAGITLNRTFGTRDVDIDAQHLPAGVTAFTAHDSPEQITIEWRDAQGKSHSWVIDPSRRQPGSLGSLQQLAEKDPTAHALFLQFGQSPARYWAGNAQRVGSLFLRLLQMVAVPLVMSSLITGILGLGKASRLAGMFVRTMVYYISTSLLAIITGIMLVRLIRPGLRNRIVIEGDVVGSVQSNITEVLWQQVESLIPTNLIAALAKPDFLSIISFSIIFGTFTLIVGGRHQQTVQSLFESIFEIMMSMTKAIIRLAPVGVLFLMLYVTATLGVGVFQSLAWYMLCVFLGLVIHGAVTLPLILYFLAGVNPWRYAQAVMPALLTAFSSASSNATLPLTMTCVEERAGISNRTTSFVLPLGATVNMDGTALYEAVAVLFVAELYLGTDLGLPQQIVVALTALLASIGAAGIPHAGLVMMLIIFQAVGLPVTLQGIIIAVDRVLDMCRTVVNVWSDACGCAVIERWQPVESGTTPTVTASTVSSP